MAYGFWLLLHDLVLHHAMQFRNLYLIFLCVSQCQGIPPCYATLELIDFLEISLILLTWPDIVSSRDPPDLKIEGTLFTYIRNQLVHRAVMNYPDTRCRIRIRFFHAHYLSHLGHGVQLLVQLRWDEAEPRDLDPGGGRVPAPVPRVVVVVVVRKILVEHLGHPSVINGLYNQVSWRCL